MKFVWGIVWVIIGIALMRYTFQITNLFGKIDWAETHLRGGFGGTYTLYRLVGLLVVIIAMLYMFGGIDLLVRPFAVLFPGGK
jgi:hypothetical protein